MTYLLFFVVVSAYNLFIIFSIIFMLGLVYTSYSLILLKLNSLSLSSLILIIPLTQLQEKFVNLFSNYKIY